MTLKSDALRICPVCGATGVPIVYGLPGADLIEQEDRGEVALGGCVISDFSPTFQCPTCENEWGTGH
jgi:hypothetical protein